ncbi:MAG: undecaprenyl-diphosphate phosphatase [bacterium]|nr:undecaprenyl-diphosphate phosphatase [bacterium]
MLFLKLIVMAVVQGLTEFLPVSSSGHLVLLHHWMEALQGDLFFDIVLHVGTLGAVVVVYRNELLRLLKFDMPALNYIAALLIGTIPAVIVGLLLKDFMEGLFGSPRAAGYALLFTGFVLLTTRKAIDKGESNSDELISPGLLKAFLIGCAQAVAITPGVSRSGMTIASSLLLGLPRVEAARFSFMLAIPAIAGALVLQLLDGAATETLASPIQLVVSAIVAFVFGLLAIRLTALAVVKSHFWKFAFYCVPLGLLVLYITRGL